MFIIGFLVGTVLTAIVSAFVTRYVPPPFPPLSLLPPPPDYYEYLRQQGRIEPKPDPHATPYGDA